MDGETTKLKHKKYDFKISNCPNFEKRLSALKKLQNLHMKYDKEMVKKIYVLMYKYHEKSLKINHMKSFYTLDIPDYWLTVFKNSPVLRTIVEPQDEDILRHLIDIKCIVNKNVTQMGFTIEFHFSPCNYMMDQKLMKHYRLNSEIYLDQRYGGLDCRSIQGCCIRWHDGMNPAMKNVEILQQHRSMDFHRTLIQQVKTESFFEFFETPNNDANKYIDFKLADYICHTIIPNSVLFYTGEFNEVGSAKKRVISSVAAFSNRLRH